MPKLIDAEAAKAALLSIDYIGDHLKRDLLAAIDALPDASEGRKKAEWCRQHIDQWRKGSENEKAQQAGDGAEER